MIQKGVERRVKPRLHEHIFWEGGSSIQEYTAVPRDATVGIMITSESSDLSSLVL